MVEEVSAQKASGYRADIDGLRAVAVASVVFFHAGLAPFASGFVGVDIFFVISGYLIGGIILREVLSGTFSFARFYARRAKRILPALFVVILATCGVGWFLLDATELKDVGVIGTLALVGASNINFWQFQDYFANDSRLRLLLMTWSLGVEEQFYVLFPFLVLATMALARRAFMPVLAVLSLASFALALWWTATAPVSAFYLLPARAWELGIGAMLAAGETGAVLARPWRLPLRWQQGFATAGLGALTVAITCFDDRVPFPGTLVLLPVFGATALLASPLSWINRRILSAPPVVFIGLVSYSWYLWHWPLMSLLRHIDPRPASTLLLSEAALVSLSLAVLSWWFVERPFRLVQPPPQATLLRYAAALGAVVAIPIVIQANRGFPARLSPEARQLEATAAELRRGRCLMSGAELSPDAECRSFLPGRPAIAILGDSHAWAIGPALRQQAAAQNVGYEIFAKASCTPLLGVSVRLPTDPKLPGDCTAFRAAAIRTILDDPRVSTVVLAGYWFAPVALRSNAGYVTETGSMEGQTGLSLLRRGLTAIVDTFTGAGKQVIVVQDVPAWDFDPLKLAIDNTMPARGAFASLFDPDISAMTAGRVPASRAAPHDEVVAVVAAAVARNPKARIVDPFSKFCDQTACVFSLKGRSLYFDDHHLSPVGATLAFSDVHLDLR